MYQEITNPNNAYSSCKHEAILRSIYESVIYFVISSVIVHPNSVQIVAFLLPFRHISTLEYELTLGIDCECNCKEGLE